MAYGPNKYTGKQFIQGILDTISDRIHKQGEFENSSLGYYGIEFTFRIDVKLLARGETNLVIEGASAQLGVNPDTHTIDEDVFQAGLTSTVEDVKTTVTVAGGSSAGTGTHTQPGDHKKAHDSQRLRTRTDKPERK